MSANGNAQFTTSDVDYLSNTCLPWSGHDCTIFPYWDDLRTDDNSGCTGYPGDTCGIYTSVSGTAPNRIFNIEWRAVYMDHPDEKANFELRLYEGENKFDVIYGTLEEGNSGATAGVQSSDTCFAGTSATAQVVRLLAAGPHLAQTAHLVRRQRLRLRRPQQLPLRQRLPPQLRSPQRQHLRLRLARPQQLPTRQRQHLHLHVHLHPHPLPHRRRHLRPGALLLATSTRSSARR